MNRFILLAFAVHSSFAAAAFAEDYLLRLDTFESVDIPEEDKDAEETMLHSIEVIARPESTFHGKVKLGEQTLTLAGELRPADRGGFRVDLRFSVPTNRGTTLQLEGGKQKFHFNTNTGMTKDVRIAVGETVYVMGLESTTSRIGEPKSRRQVIRHILVLTKYEPSND